MIGDLEPVADLDLRALRANIRQEDDDLVIVLDDGDVCIRLLTGLGGMRVDAILGCERLVTTTVQFALLLQEHTAHQGPAARLQPGEAP